MVGGSLGASMAQKHPLIVIIGETGSGKSALGLELAEKFDGEIICADSRTVYKGMDIGTAKPSLEEQGRVRHHLLDLVDPNERFTVADFKRQAQAAADEINQRGKLPIMVGGSGLYIDAFLFDYSFAGSNALKSQQNPRHLAATVTSAKRKLRPDTLVLGIQLPREQLRERLSKRVEVMVLRGFEQEVRTLTACYGVETPVFRTPGYSPFIDYLSGSIALAEAKKRFIKGDMDLAKKQRTWFKRNKYIQWSGDPSKLVALATTFLNNYK
jgi:tRNA dimethylallyltransferase